ncbi:MAG: nucleoside triphosphate pyrophosphohydrolase [Oscillospiraceae bacterium]|nr:nucleoside triphosphate pyrophosphohydrolase [Oscillospiraceae bacterium]
MHKERYQISDLILIMDKLRSPGGCPWDREQDHKSIRRNLVEETYEAAEAIDNDDADLLCEELGDILLQVVFHARIADERGAFDFGDVCDGICRKLITRHPHIFADTVVKTSGEALNNWDEIKRMEKNRQSAVSALEAVSKALPALIRSEKVQHRAAKTGFDYRNTEEALCDLKNELKELEQAIASGGHEEIHEELGDLLFAAVNVSRFTQTDAEKSLSDSCEKFISRFGKVEELAKARGIDMKAADMDLLNSLWIEAKNK